MHSTNVTRDLESFKSADVGKITAITYTRGGALLACLLPRASCNFAMMMYVHTRGVVSSIARAELKKLMIFIRIIKAMNLETLRRTR